MDLCHLKHSELEKHLQSIRGESCSKETSSKTTVASERYSRRELQLRQWQQNSWMQFADSLAWRVQRRGIGLHAGAHVGSTRMRLKNLWFLPERNLYGHTLAGLLWDRKLEEVLVKRVWERGTDVGVRSRLPKTTTNSCMFMWTISRWLERKKN